MTIFALDLATRTGFAHGLPGCGQPISGSVRFASEGASHEAMFAAACTWATEQFRAVKPATVVWEAPLPTSFKFSGATNVNTSMIVFGLPAIVGAVAYLLGIYDIRKVRTIDVRRHFIGDNPRGKRGKQLTIAQCRKLRWAPHDDNEADALAIWSYTAALLDPAQALRPTPLFGTVIA